MARDLETLKKDAREDLVERMHGEWPGQNNACDMATECADEMTPIHTPDLMALASDSEVWHHRSEMDGEPTIESLTTRAVYEILSNYLHGELDDIREELESAETAREELDTAIESAEEQAGAKGRAFTVYRHTDDGGTGYYVRPFAAGAPTGLLGSAAVPIRVVDPDGNVANLEERAQD